MRNEELVLTVRDKEGEIIKEVTAHTFSIYWGTINDLMELVSIDENTSSFEVLKKLSGAWGQVTEIMGEIFPGMTPEDWKYVRINDLVPVVMQVIKYTFAEIMGIPSDKKN